MQACLSRRGETAIFTTHLKTVTVLHHEQWCPSSRFGQDLLALRLEALRYLTEVGLAASTFAEKEDTEELVSTSEHEWTSRSMFHTAWHGR